jgi:predicted O-methyltransferase YrrM
LTGEILKGSTLTPGRPSRAHDAPELFRRRFRQHPLPFSLCLLARRALAGRGADPLLPRRTEIATDGSRLRDPALAASLRGTRLGRHAMSAPALDHIVDEVLARRPVVVLEFGSGVSTLVLALLMGRLHGPDGPAHLFSVEQSGEALERTRRRLHRLRVARRVRLLRASSVPQVIGGFRTVCYAPAPGRLEQFLEGRRADFVLIDGPAGPHGCRFGVIPLARPVLAPGAVVFLDDALRDSELAAAAWWERLRLLRPDGIHWIGKGLLRAGTVPRGSVWSAECELLEAWLRRAVARNRVARAFRLRPPGMRVAT